MSSVRGYRWRFESTLAGLAGGDLLARLAPELLGLGDSLVLPAGFVVASSLVLDWTTIGWLFGWVLFGSVVFQMAPLLFPVGVREWAHGLPNRAAMAVNAVGVGVFVETFVLEQFRFGTTPLPVDVGLFPVVLGGVVCLSLLSQALPPVRARSGLLYTFEESTYPSAGFPDVFVTQYVLLVLVVGTLLAEVSLLFPLPELLILAAVGYDVTTDVVGVGDVPARRDVAERVVQGGSAVWYGMRGIVLLLYSLAGLFAVFLLDYLYVELLGLWTLLSVRPVDAAFVLYCLTGATVLVAVANVRFAERIPAQLRRQQGNRKAILRTSRSDPLETDQKRLPGFMVPAGLLVLSLEVARPAAIERLPAAAVPPLSLPAPVVGLALLAGALGVVTLLWPERLPSTSFTDYLVAPLSLACFLTLGIGLGFADVGALAAGDLAELGRAVRSALLVFVVALAPFVGYEVAPLERQGAGPLSAIAKAVGGLLLVVATYFVLAVLLPGSFLDPSSAVGYALTSVFVALSILLSASVLAHVFAFAYLAEAMVRGFE